MKKTSVYLDLEQARQLSELATVAGRPQAQVLREAIAEYARAATARVSPNFGPAKTADRLAEAASEKAPAVPDRDFLCAGIADGPGGSIADVPEDELLKGFGE